MDEIPQDLIQTADKQPDWDLTPGGWNYIAGNDIMPTLSPMKTARMFLRIPILLALLSGILAAQDTAKTAIFVNNLAGQQLAAKSDAYEALLAAQLNGRGYSVLSQREIADTLQKAPEGEQDSSVMLATQTSALRLAQLLGADYILVANLISLGAERKAFSGSGIDTVNKTWTLRASYGLLDASRGGGLEGNTFTVSKTIRDDGSLKIEDGDILNQLLQEASERVAKDLTRPGVLASLPPPASRAEPVTFTVRAILQGIQLPNIMIGPDNEIRLTERRFPVEAVGVDVSLDGVIQGSAPGEFAAMPGIHRLRLTREGFTTWERNVNLYEGFTLNAAMDLTPEGLKQWQEITAFLQDLQTGAQLTAAEVKVLEGKAQSLRQSGYLVNTTEAPVVNLFNSLWGPPFLGGVPVID